MKSSMSAIASRHSALGPQMSTWQRSQGFSLFELVVFIIAVAIIYATAANRFAEFPGQAERANFLAITTQLQSAVNLEMLFGVQVGKISSPTMLEGVNPMDLMLETPRNYIGAFDTVDNSRTERRVWYFDQAREELVYLVNDTTGVFLIVNGIDIPADEIRFKIVADYGEYDRRTGLPLIIAEREGNSITAENRVTKLEGVTMRPVIPFKWGMADVGVLLDEANSGNSG